MKVLDASILRIPIPLLTTTIKTRRNSVTVAGGVSSGYTYLMHLTI